MGGWAGRKGDLGRLWAAGLAGKATWAPGPGDWVRSPEPGAGPRLRFFFETNFNFYTDARSFWHLPVRQRPYCAECTRSHPNSEVKQRKARIVLGWGTAWEVLRVPLAFFFFTFSEIVNPVAVSQTLPPCCRQRPYCVEYTRSHPNSEVKRRKARSVLGWGTAWEALRVPLAFMIFAHCTQVYI